LLILRFVNAGAESLSERPLIQVAIETGDRVRVEIAGIVKLYDLPSLKQNFDRASFVSFLVDFFPRNLERVAIVGRVVPSAIEVAVSVRGRGIELQPRGGASFGRKTIGRNL
jgi:hypothetical protein